MSTATTKKKTTTKSKTTRPRTSDKKAPISAVDSKNSVPTPAAEPVVTPQAQAVVLGPMMRKKELIERVVARSGIKKKDAKPVVEAMLAELGEALAENRELVLPPMGKIKIKRERELPNGRMMVVKIRQSARTAAEPAQDAAE